MPRTMQAVAIDRFGECPVLGIQEVAIPGIGPDEVLVRVAYAGIGAWDPFEREGGYAQLLGIQPSFPYILGSEGAGVVAAVGANVRGFHVGQAVFALGFLNPKGGFYAEYAAVNSAFVARVPRHLSLAQAAAMGGVGITALRGLTDCLYLKPGDTIAVMGASGGIGHMAVQLARMMGARVLGVASGDDGVALVRALGADCVIDGHEDDILAAALSFAPSGLDAALLTAGGEQVERILRALKAKGRAAYPNGVQLTEEALRDPRLHGYNGEPDQDIIRRLLAFAERDGFSVHVAHVYQMEQVAEAHEFLGRHHLGKLVLKISG